jgi:rhodanese-related sulfurtransferase
MMAVPGVLSRRANRTGVPHDHEPRTGGDAREHGLRVINVHIPLEGEIARTDAFIPFDRIGENLDQLSADKDAAVVLCCRSGRMSEIAANELAARGYTNVSHLAGGMSEWVRAGYELAGD